MYFVADRTGQITLSIVCCIWVYCTTELSCLVFWPLVTEWYSKTLLVAILTYWITALITIYLLYRAATTRPGLVVQEFDASSLSPDVELMVCAKCQAKRPPRSHHCSRCNKCVLRMDHHCLFINNCVGERNLYLFMLLLFYADLISAQTLCYTFYWIYYVDENVRTSYGFEVAIRFGGLLALLLLVCLVPLLIVAIYNVLLNRTTLENLRDPFGRELVNSYFKRNQKRLFRPIRPSFTWLCGTSSCFGWLNPFRSRSVSKMQFDQPTNLNWYLV